MAICLKSQSACCYLKRRRDCVICRGRGDFHQEVGQLGLKLKVFPHVLSVYTLQPDGKQTVEIGQEGLTHWKCSVKVCAYLLL